ncbi:MAG: hypothetical protein K2X66_18145 [Cyanobacteria bacterium]|nr:hypothetical protein [Cyanobacteriota bacterium]
MSYEKKIDVYRPNQINSYGPSQITPFGPNSIGNVNSRNAMEANTLTPEGFGSGFSKKKDFSGGYEFSENKFTTGETGRRMNADLYGGSIPGFSGFITPNKW